MCKHCWDDDERGAKPHHKDWIRGWADDGFEDPRHRKSAKAKKRKKVPGCPGNEGKAHVYVWTTEVPSWLNETIFFKVFGYYKWEIRVCCGCGKRNGTRKTERYMKKAKNKYDYWEHRDERFIKERERMRAKYGWRYYDWI